MAKKDFSQIETGRVYDTITAATAEEKARKERKTYTDEEARALQMDMNTTGRKGVRMKRLNIAVTPDVSEYIYTMSRVSGETLSMFIVRALREHMDAHADIYKKAIAFRNSLDGVDE
jgi:hypothetical protein